MDEYISKANDKLISSKILFDNQQYATSVSAAYYCMFLTVKAVNKKDQYPKSHECLISLWSSIS
ncbi:HEPN domain-containing protein [Methanobrevibacter sp.]|uniref:HEPN domain-containing protein n=1 Tax=Methanobrevibacter sp. TaxID=66852 RepID=UPI00388DD906